MLSSLRRLSRLQRGLIFMVAIHKPAHDIILKPVVSEKSYALSDRGLRASQDCPSSELNGQTRPGGLT